MLPCSGDLVTGQSNRMPPVVSLHRRFSRLTSGSKSQSRKILRNFSIIWVFRFLATLSSSLFTSGSSNREVYSKTFTDPFAIFSRKSPCLAVIFQNFVSKVFGGSIWRLVRNSFQSQKSRVLHNEGLFQDRFQKLFIFPSQLVIIHLLVCLSLFQNHRVHTHILHILLHLFTNLQEKVWV